MSITREIIVHGNVQGVGFRSYVLRQAIRFGIKGEVWNAYDGTVHVIAQHLSENVINSFKESLSSGPGKVTLLSCDELTNTPRYDSFSITPSR